MTDFIRLPDKAAVETGVCCILLFGTSGVGKSMFLSAVSGACSSYAQVTHVHSRAMLEKLLTEKMLKLVFFVYTG